MSELAALVAPYLDLDNAPFTYPGSRLLVLRAADGVTVRLAEYEKRLDDCVVVETVRVLDSAGAPLEVTAVFPDRIEFGDGSATLVFAGPDALSIGARGVGAHGDDLVVSLALPDAAESRIPISAGGPSVRIAAGEAPRSSMEPHPEHEAIAAALWDDWFARCPVVRPDLQAMTAFCWWVLGANIVTLPGQAGSRAVVPSKIGYVGLWQWDAYFIATGLRHGDPELAREQLDLAFRFPTAEGQLPDVVHDEGVLASSEDLPPADRENLRRAGSTIADPDAPIPLTKPPLAAWALRKVLEVIDDDPAWAAAAWETVARSQDWWFAHSDLNGDGMPEYGHPYSSGLDDNPIFDHELPVTSPDLASYLIVQDRELADHFAATGDLSREAEHRERAAATLEMLLATWDDAAGFFRARSLDRELDEYTVVSLLPLLTGGLPEAVVTRMLEALDDPELFATPYTVPTVARGDAQYSADRMWRGPVWVNTNALLAEGLEKSGHPDRARELAERTVKLVIHGGGPHEYYNSLTGLKAPGATTSFGWSAALFIDLAVRLS